jgi:hypothetical protein
MSTYGYVSEREMVSTSSASQTTLEREWCARFATLTRPRYEVRPPPRATDFDTMVEEVYGARCSILAPASWCWPSPANATERTSPLACSPMRKTDGYFMVTLEPMLPSIHSMVAPSSHLARLVTRLYTLFDQFWIVVYRQWASFFTMISTTAECSESEE